MLKGKLHLDWENYEQTFMCLMGNHTTFGLPWVWNNLQPSVPITWTWKLCQWEIPVLTWNLGLTRGSFHIYLYGLFPDTWTVWEIGEGWVGHLMPSNERGVEDTLKYFKPNNYFHLSHLQSNIKSLNFTENSKLVSIWFSRLVKKKTNKKIYYWDSRESTKTRLYVK